MHTIKVCAALLLLGAGTILATTAATGAVPNPKNCKAQIKAEAIAGLSRSSSGFSMGDARAKARAAWESKASSLYGPVFANFDKAAGKSIRCGFCKGWAACEYCTATGRPCARSDPKIDPKVILRKP